MTSNVCNLGSKYPFFNRAYLVSSCFWCPYLYGSLVKNLQLLSILCISRAFYRTGKDTKAKGGIWRINPNHSIGAFKKVTKPSTPRNRPKSVKLDDSFWEVDNDSYPDKSEVVVWEKSIPILPQAQLPESTSSSPMVRQSVMQFSTFEICSQLLF